MATCQRHNAPVGENGTCVLCEGARLAEEDRGKRQRRHKPRLYFQGRPLPAAPAPMPEKKKRGRAAASPSDVFHDDAPDEIDLRRIAIDPAYF